MDVRGSTATSKGRQRLQRVDSDFRRSTATSEGRQRLQRVDSDFRGSAATWHHRDGRGIFRIGQIR